MPSTGLSGLETVNDLLLYRLGRLVATGGSLVVRLCEGQFGITRREWRLLAQLALRPGLSPTELASLASLDKARTSRAIGGLVDKGLLERRPLPQDRRQAELVLTAAGQALYEQLMPEARRINRELLAPLSAAELVQLDGLLTRLQTHASLVVQHNDDQLPRVQRHKGGRSRLVQGAGR
ncbi:MAG: MarR family transcriptional regulator [Burkholderiales bacterium]|nr:MarR family transcriptional regulator [Burkholderiales bacterium]